MAKKNTKTKSTPQTNPKTNVKTKKTKKPAKTEDDFSTLKKDTRLISIDDWDWDRIIYSEPKENNIPDSAGKYRRVWINYRYDDETMGPAIVELGSKTPKFSFGVQPDNTDKDGNIIKDDKGRDKSLRGYRVPIVMSNQGQDKSKPSKEEQNEIAFFDAWRDELLRYAIENKKAIGKGSISEAKLDGMVSEVLYRKKDEDGLVIEDKAPTLYTNLKYFGKTKSVGTAFYGPGDKEVDPLTMTGHFHIYPTIQLSSIYVGKGLSLQHQIHDATVEPVSRAPQKRLARPNKMTAEEEDDEDEEEGEQGGTDPNDMMESEDEEEEDEDEDDE